MTEYTSAIATAKRLIDKKGASVTWRKFNIDAGAEDWLEVPEGTPFTDYTVKMVLLPYEGAGRYVISVLQGSFDVPTYDLYGLMAQVPFSPVKRDLIISTAHGELQPEKITPLCPADEVVLYILGLKG